MPSARSAIAWVSLVLIGCTGSVAWEPACGCGPMWEWVAHDLGHPPSIGEEAMTPQFVAAETEKRLKGKPLTLETIRGIGSHFDSSCILRGLAEVRCTFWMWTFEDEHRGIELQFEQDEQGHNVGHVRGQYIYDKSDKNG